MVSKNKIKFIRSLEFKKNRVTSHRFVAEGPKVVGDLLGIQQAETLICTKSWLDIYEKKINAKEIIDTTDDELKKISFLQHPQQVLAVFEYTDKSVDNFPCKDKLSLALDNVQDPGNLGTIIRIADWFGIENIYCSKDTADLFNPKVVQATMGSIARVNVIYTDLGDLMNNLPDDFPIYGTFLDGKSIYDQSLSSEGLVVMGNEGKGISKEIAKRINHRLLIPNYPPTRETADSLNVAIATAITCSEFRRKR